MATIKEAITLKHRANLSEAVEDVSFVQGDEVTVLKEWSDHYLYKNADGRVFNILKAHVEA